MRNIGTVFKTFKLMHSRAGLVHAGMKRGHARKLLTAIVAKKAKPPT